LGPRQQLQRLAALRRHRAVGRPDVILAGLDVGGIDAVRQSQQRRRLVGDLGQVVGHAPRPADRADPPHPPPQPPSHPTPHAPPPSPPQTTPPPPPAPPPPPPPRGDTPPPPRPPPPPRRPPVPPYTARN